MNYVMKPVLLILIVLLPQLAVAMNREGRLDGGRQRNVVRDFEKEGNLQRDLLGRKVVISPNSTIDGNSLQLEVAPRSTVILNIQQHDNGTQTTRTPFYQNVEMPK
ncbi:MAG: hypothetical protein COV35_11170 [Alphaproteobacteria bacterium CG11_big_fil_rev_8_21_14_0_20_39_49]|nr:MAG: hypothetical protein COV35_11170 [Alphaproteobacteria bacterium CG11_big_fil_rev_8_21_14_0_20_39_49]